ncbi:hypothetical protein GQX73_g5202 [Xylaria multiplex]|uniref:Uncharacterized protein n=1 Tax=Xylaria multiplex TaxID=323545 RepID=A0A7C8MPR4_9PEZI|nr:hypothetical protein GQX73_g5202 [Xylaria multiplex]
MIEPTAEYERFYNQCRRETDSQRFEFCVPKNDPEPPSAELISWSTTNDAYPSLSGGHPRLDTGVQPVFKKEFKLTRAFHSVKRVKCKCHDFSRLRAAIADPISDPSRLKS